MILIFILFLILNYCVALDSSESTTTTTTNIKEQTTTSTNSEIENNKITPDSPINV